MQASPIVQSLQTGTLLAPNPFLQLPSVKVCYICSTTPSVFLFLQLTAQEVAADAERLPSVPSHLPARPKTEEGEEEQEKPVPAARQKQAAERGSSEYSMQLPAMKVARIFFHYTCSKLDGCGRQVSRRVCLRL